MKADIEAQAIVWVIRLREGGDLDWDAFDAWLASDPAHAAAFHEAEDTDAALEKVLPHLDLHAPANDTEPSTGIVDEPVRARPLWRWVAAAGAVAACAVGAATILPFLRHGRYEVVTVRGENQIVTLDEGTRITLNGATHMVFDRRDPRFAELKDGEALFHVRHDARSPFRLRIDGNDVEDTGTVFNVAREGAVLRVAVAEGSVVYNPGRNGVELSAGQELAAQGNLVKVVSTDAQSVGAWQKGHLVYQGEPLARVAGDLSRALDKQIRPTESLANRPFFGTLFLEGSPDEKVRHIEAALGVRFEAGGDGLKMVPVQEPAN